MACKIAVEIGPADALAPGERKLVFIQGRSVAVFNVDGEIYAVENSCPHNGASLAGGQIEGRLLQCPAHGLRFDVATGCMPGKGGLSLKTIPVRTVAGRMELIVD